MTEDERYLTFMGRGPRRVVHWEHWSNPDAETYLTGIDYYRHPRLCRQRMAQLYPQLRLPIPDEDTPISPPKQEADRVGHTTRWGDTESGWEHGEAYFKSAEEALAFSPLKKADFTDWPSVSPYDYSSEEILYQTYRKRYPAEWGDKAPAGSAADVGIYTTMFMWPLLTFGWELFLEICLEKEFERIMDEFAELNRRLFRAFARLPVNFVVCHDDIVMTNGPICSPAWMNKYIFPRYEEFFGMLKAAGKEVIFMADGCMDAYADDVMACGARGIISEPYPNYKAIARRHKDAFIAGEGDSRILQSGDKAAIKKMVDNMVETAKMSGGYMMCIGNHIPWNVPGEAVKYYLDYSAEAAYRY